ncbi:MAG: hypothetical protein JOY53_00480 [Acidobacteriaceae bacterium]|nr:hypothetical protein [Acidobacteriaceae bacterium]
MAWWAAALFTSRSIAAQTLPVQVIGVTPTQAMLSYTAPDGNACSVAVSENSSTDPNTGAFLSLVHDVDPNLFPGADRDTRNGNLVNGAARTIVIGFRGTGDASDGHIYSRALQANTTHYYQITCADGTYAGAGLFTTANVPLGNSAPDPIPYDPNSWGGWGWPTIDYSDRSPNYIDPQTGILLKRWTKPGDNGFINSGVPFSAVADLAGSWQNPANIGATADGQYATYTGVGGSSNALFLWGEVPFDRPSFLPVTWNVPDDTRIHLNGFGDQPGDADRRVSVCLSADYGQSCAGSSVDVILPQTNPADVSAPSSWPAPLFSGWGNAPITPDMLTNNFTGTLAAVSGSTVIWGASSFYGYNNYFPVTALEPGDKILISGTDPVCPQNLCTISGITDEKTLTIQQNLTAGNPSVNQYQFPNFGFKLWKKTGVGAISIDSAVSDWASSATMFTEYQGAGDPYCSANTVTATYAADGVTPIPPLAGYICSFKTNWGNSILYFVAASTGEARKLSNLNNLSLAFSPNPTNFYAYNNATGTVQQCSYDANDATNGRFKEWSDGYNTALENPAFTCSDLTPGNETIPEEISAAHPEIDEWYFGEAVLTSVSFPLFEFRLRPVQNSLAWFCTIDVSQPAGPTQVAQCRNTWDTYPVRWLGAHGTESFLTEQYELMSVQVPLNSAGVAGVEQWSLDVLTVYNNGGSTAVPRNFYDPQTCEALGVTDLRWIAQGATGGNCIKVNVQTEPVAINPAQSDLQALGALPVGSRPAAWAHNSTSCGGDGTTTNCWSYLQPLQEGDYLQDAAQGPLDEKFLVAKKTALANGTIDLVLARNMNPFGCRASPAPMDHAAGWIPIMWPPQSCAAVDFISKAGDPASAAVPDNPQTYSGHTVSWVNSRNLEQHVTPYSWNLDASVGGYGAAYGVRTGVFPQVVGESFQFGLNSVYPFAGSNNGLSINQIQSHPGGVTTSASQRESQWAVDGRPLGVEAGGDQYLWNHTLTKIDGTQNVYQISLPLDSANGSPISFSGSDVRLDRKRRQMLAFAGNHLLRDISGPGSLITDSIPWSYCVADFPGECVPGSQQGSQYVSVPEASTTGVCSNDGTILAPCLATAGPHAAAYVQFDISRPDPFGLRWRKLTNMFNGPGRTDNYANMHSLATGDWGVSTVKWGDGRRTDIFGVKLPPWPNEDSIIRNNFVTVPVSLGGVSGSQVRIRFGYNTGLFCSTRQEQCSTAAANSDPYAWLSEPQSWTPCGNSGCTVNIPAISSRVLYYVVDRMTASGTVISGPMMLTAVN